MKSKYILLTGLLAFVGSITIASAQTGVRLEDPGFQNLNASTDAHSYAVFETDPSGALATSGEFTYLTTLIQSGAADPVFGTTPDKPEFYINTTTGEVFFNDGTQWLSGNAETVTQGGVGDGPPNDATNDPANPLPGDTYFDVDDSNKQYTFDGVNWIAEAAAATETVTTGGVGDGPPDDATNDPVAPVSGDTYFDVDAQNTQYTYDGAAWVKETRKLCETVTDTTAIGDNTMTINVPAGYAATDLVGTVLLRAAGSIELGVTDYTVAGAVITVHLTGVETIAAGHTLNARFEMQ